MKRSRVYPENVLRAAELLGAQIRQGRIGREWTVRALAERAGVSAGTLVRIERGDPTVAIGTVFDVAVLVGVPLYYEDQDRLRSGAARERERAVLLARRVRPSGEEPDYDF
jgi:transcriptional regulator with XRE-family HTH domain